LFAPRRTRSQVTTRHVPRRLHLLWRQWCECEAVAPDRYGERQAKLRHADGGFTWSLPATSSPPRESPAQVVDGHSRAHHLHHIDPPCRTGHR